jgi:protein-S-isoprenylcysteine O-methyltransferase Ste14
MENFINIDSFWYGIIGIGALLLYDINSVEHNNERLESLYVVGGGLLGLMYLDVIPKSLAKEGGLPTALRIVFGVLAGVSFLLTAYSAFFVGKRTRWGTKRKNNANWWERELADRGLYAMCRHPSALFFLIMNISLIYAVNYVYYQAVIFSVAGILLAYYEDRNVFPELVRGYDEYKRSTPFILPNRESLRRCRETFGKKKTK